MNQKQFDELLYKLITCHAIKLANGNSTESAKQLLEGISRVCVFAGFKEYGCIRGVLQACHRRANEEGMESLEVAFVGSNGKPLLK